MQAREYHRVGLALALNLACFFSQKVDAAPTTIHFSDYPDGTLASAYNPYGEFLYLQAQGGTQYGTNSDPNPQNLSTYWTDAFIVNGALQVISSGAIPPNCYPVNYSSRLSATFGAPVINVSFDAWCWRPGVYSYSGFDADGNPFAGSGTVLGIIDNGVPAGTWITYTLGVPAGGFLSEFNIRNQDPSASNGAFWVNDIRFTPVPEPGSITLAALGAASLLATRRSAKSRG